MQKLKGGTDELDLNSKRLRNVDAIIVSQLIKQNMDLRKLK